jgi:hypothetical protein
MGEGKGRRDYVHDRPGTKGAPYAGIENLRPETKALVKSYTDARKLLE